MRRVKLGDGTVVETRVAAIGFPARARCGSAFGPEAVRVAQGGGTPRPRSSWSSGSASGRCVYARLADGQPITAEDEGDSQGQRSAMRSR